MKCLLRNDDETLQGPCLTVKREEWDSSTKRMNRKKGPTEKITEKEKSMTSTQYNYENKSSMTQKEKLVVHMKTIEKRYRDLA